LNPQERLELLTLLEQRDRTEAERPIDDRPPLWRVFGGQELETFIRAAGHDPEKLPDGPLADKLCNEFNRDRAAAQSVDPVAYVKAWEVHRAAMQKHLARLKAELPPFELPSRGVPFDLEALFRREVLDLGQQAEDLARADGILPPEEVVPLKAPEPAAEAPLRDPLESGRHAAMRRASLPRATLADIEDSRVTHADLAIYDHIVAETDESCHTAISRRWAPNDRWLCLFVWCRACHHQAPADLRAIIAGGQGDRPLKDLRFRCAQCGSRMTDSVMMSRDALAVRDHGPRPPAASPAWTRADHPVDCSTKQRLPTFPRI
jgi:hypothetical protein